MKRVAEDLYLLHGVPPNAMNVYLMGGVLVDAATKLAIRRIRRQLRDQDVVAHALTHGHADHQGASHAICTARNIELWCGEGDRVAVESGRVTEAQPDAWINRVHQRLWAGPAHPVARVLREGDQVGGFTVLEVPGHSAGHLAYWRESDRVLVAGDVLNGQSLITGRPGLHEPPAIFTPDPARNRQSARRLAALEPAVVCFGHGPPMRDTRRFAEFVEALPA